MINRSCFSLLFVLSLLTLPVLGEETKETPNSSDAALTTVDPQIPIDHLEVMVKPLTKAELEVEAKAWFTLLRNKARQIAAARLGVKKTNQAIIAENGKSAIGSLKAARDLSDLSEAKAEQEQEEIISAAQERLGVDDVVPDVQDESTLPEGDSDATASQLQQLETQAIVDDEVATEELASQMKGDLLEDVSQLQDERTVLADRLAVVLLSLERKGGDVQEYRTYASAVSGIEVDTTDIRSAWHGLVGWLMSKEGGQRMLWNFFKFVVILLITYLIASIIARIINWTLDRKIHLSQLAERLISQTIKNVLMLIGFAIALTALEVDIGPVMAAIGATGLVVGLALQGTLSNFASGLMILINRPFDVGDVVSAGGVTGTINQMNLVSTTFRSFDNQTIHVPNNQIWDNVITNITANETRRVDMEFGIGYDDDFENAESIINEIVSSHNLVLKEPAPAVITHELGDSAVKIVCRPHAKTSDWWQVKTDVTREVKRRFDQAGISIPFPQQDIHLHSIADK